jgi:hypothetical protein
MRFSTSVFSIKQSQLGPLIHSLKYFRISLQIRHILILRYAMRHRADALYATYKLQRDHIQALCATQRRIKKSVYHVNTFNILFL